MLIDVHVHTFPDDLAGRALKKLVEKTGNFIAPAGDGTVAGLLCAMRRDGVDYAAVCPIATKPEQADGILAEALAIRDGERGASAARHLIPFASVHPADEACFAHLTRVAESGVRGIKLHPYYQSFVLDAPPLLEYFRCCRDLNLVVQCHCGFDIGFPFDPVCGPERVARVVSEVPGLRFIAAHLGGWRQWGGAAEQLLGKDVYLDTAVLLPHFGDEGVRRILREHPSDRLLFATDWPWLGFAEGIRFVRASGLEKAQTDAVLGGNAARLLGLAAPAPW
jgi:predicted TIM-barrel fold metal-dependent hydrolase